MAGLWLKTVLTDQAKSGLLWASLAFIGVLLLLALVLAWFERWRKRGSDETSGTGNQLSSFRSLYERGELSQEEYDRVHALLTNRMKREFDLPPQPTPAPSPEQPPSPDPPKPGPTA